MRFRLTLIQYAEKFGVTKAAIKYKTNGQYICCWKNRLKSTIPCVQTDNGNEFTNRFTTQRDKSTLFQVHLEQHGIEHKMIRSFTPRHNGNRPEISKAGIK